MAMTAEQLAIMNAARERAGKPPMPSQGQSVEASQGSLYTPTTVARQTVGQGLALGFGDEIEGFARGIYKAATEGKPYGAAVNEEISKIRTSNKQFEDENPLGSTALQLGGGLLTGGAGLLRAGAMRAPTLLGRVGRSVLPSAATGSVAGAGMSEGGLADRAVGAAGGAVLGAGLGALTPVATRVVGSGARAVGRMMPGRMGGAERQAKRLISNVGAEDELQGANLGQRLDDFGDEAMAADVGGPATRDLARYAGNKFGGRKVETALEQRHLGQAPRIGQSIDENIAGDTLEDFIDTTTRARRETAEINYGQLYERQVSMSPALAKLFQNNKIKQAYETAKEIADAEGRTLPPLFKVGQGGETYLPPTMRTLDYIKRGLDDDVNVAFNNGRPGLGTSLKTLRDDFRDVVDKVVPEYKAVRSVYAGQSAAMDAANLGKDFILNRKGVSKIAVSRLGEHEKKSFLVGVADGLRLKVMSAPDEADVVKRIFGNPNSRARISQALDGDKDALAAFQKTMEREAAFAKTNASVRFGSRTNPMAEQGKAFEDVGGFLGDAAVLTSGVPSPASAGRMGTRIADFLKTPPESVARRVSELMLSNDPTQRQIAARLMSSGQALTTRAAGPSSSAVGGAASFQGGSSGGDMINALTGRR